MRVVNEEMDHTTSAENKQRINAVKVCHDEHKNISGCLTVATFH